MLEKQEVKAMLRMQKCMNAPGMEYELWGECLFSVQRHLNTGQLTERQRWRPCCANLTAVLLISEASDLSTTSCRIQACVCYSIAIRTLQLLL